MISAREYLIGINYAVSPECARRTQVGQDYYQHWSHICRRAGEVFTVTARRIERRKIGDEYKGGTVFLIFERIQSKLERLRLNRSFPTKSSYRIERLGSSYGGWNVPVDLLTPGMICYTVGVGEDTSFDELLITEYECDVFAFDPTPRAISHATEVSKRLGRFKFYPIGLWDENTTLKFYAPGNPDHVSYSAVSVYDEHAFLEAECWTVDTAIDKLGHSKIDLLKLDVEGAEYRIVRDMLTKNIRPRILCLELHRTRSFRDTKRLIVELISSGYNVLSVDGWDFTLVLDD